MAKPAGFIGPWIFTWTFLLITISYAAFYTKSTLESVVLRYGRIFYYFEIWRLFTTFFSIGYPTYYMKLFIFILLIHLRRYEYNPFQVSDHPNEKCDFLFTVLYSMFGFWIVSLFYPLYYAPYFVIMVLLTLVTMKEKEDSFDLIGFSVKRCLLPIIYACLTYVINKTIMCEVFAILWGIILIEGCKETSSFYPFFQSMYKKLMKILGVKEISYTQVETLREKNLARYYKRE